MSLSRSELSPLSEESISRLVRTTPVPLATATRNRPGRTTLRNRIGMDDTSDGHPPRTPMNIPDEFRSLSEAIESGTNAETVYSTPIERGDRTVVPMARVEYGLGGGGGGGGGGADGVGGGGGTSGDDDDTEGGGLGGGLSARPAGALVVTDRSTRFVTPIDRRQSTVLVLAGFVCGLVFCRLLRAIGIGR